MKKFLIVVIGLMCSINSTVSAQWKGIEFVKDLNWKQVKDKAKHENKFIFVHLSATWCRPCQYMTTEIFPLEQVGQFINPRFVSLQIQMDSTDQDSPFVKSWYAEAAKFAKDYDIQSYPTFLIFNPSGDVVHRIVGANDAPDFLDYVKDGLAPDRQYYTLLKKFTKTPQNTYLASHMAKAANIAFDGPTAAKAESILANSLSTDELFKKENLHILLSSVKFTNSKGFDLVRNNKEKIDILLEAPGIANRTLANIIVNELLQLKTDKDYKKEPDWIFYQEKLSSQYPDIDFNPVFKRIKAHYYLQTRDYVAMKNIINEYLLSEDFTPSQLNTFAWTIFDNSDDKECLLAALSWSKKSIIEELNSAYLDTYANLLYKLGEQQKAIHWQQKAIEMASEDDRPVYQNTLDKMVKSLETWTK